MPSDNSFRLGRSNTQILNCSVKLQLAKLKKISVGDEMHADLRKLRFKNGLALLKMESQWFKKVLLIFSSDLIV